MKRVALAILTLALFGAARLKVEQALSEELVAERLQLNTGLDLSVRDQVGQNAFVAAFGGFRSLMASLISLEAYGEWRFQNWGKVDSLDAIATKLMPHSPHYWDLHASHVGYDAASFYLYEASNLSKTMREDLFAEYVDKGQAIYDEGLRNNPLSWKMIYRTMEYVRKRRPDRDRYISLARLLLDNWGEIRDDDPVFRPTPDWIERFLAYELARRNGNDGADHAEAYALLKKRYAEGDRQGTLITMLNAFEILNDVPEDQHIPERAEAKFLTQALKDLRGAEPK